jgi:hypothetical protein
MLWEPNAVETSSKYTKILRCGQRSRSSCAVSISASLSAKQTRESNIVRGKRWWPRGGSRLRMQKDRPRLQQLLRRSRYARSTRGINVQNACCSDACNITRAREVTRRGWAGAVACYAHVDPDRSSLMESAVHCRNVQSCVCVCLCVCVRVLSTVHCRDVHSCSRCTVLCVCVAPTLVGAYTGRCQ